MNCLFHRVVNRLVLVGFILLTNSVQSTAQEQAEPLKFLFIGNSYTYMNEMSSMFEKMASKSGNDVIVERNTRGGASFRIHTGRQDMFEAIRKRQWDHIILQGFSRELTFRPTYLDTATVPFVNQILDSIYANNPCTEVHFYMTWGYEVGFPVREEINTFEKMADSIRMGYKWLGNHYNLSVVPVGMVWKDVRMKDNIHLYDADGAHPNPVGSYLIAASFYSALFNKPLEENFIARVSKRKAKRINRRAYEYISDHRMEYDLDRNRFDIEVNYLGKRKGYEVNFEANYPAADSVVWYFDDSTSFTVNKGSLHYSDQGSHLVHLRTHEECGTRDFRTNVVLQPRRGRRRFGWICRYKF